MTTATRIPLSVALPEAAITAAVRAPRGRRCHPTPVEVRFDGGRLCPHDAAPLHAELAGLVCHECLAWWDVSGRHGRWLAGHAATPAAAPQRLRRLDRRLATTVAAGMGAAFTFAAGRQARPVADAVPVELVWAVVVLLAVVAGVAGVMAVCQWYAEWAPYRHNRVLGPAAEPAPLAAEQAVSDGR